MAEPSEAVRRVQELIKPGRDEQEKRQKQYDSAYDIYRASVPNPASLRPWESKLRVPYGRQVIDTELVNIVGDSPRVIVRPRHPAWADNAKAMQQVLNHEIREDHMVEKQPVFAQQALILGVTVAKVHWLYRKQSRKLRGPDGKARDTDVVLRDGPTFEPWSAYRCYWSPGARSADDAEYVVLQTYLSKAELERDRYNPDTGTGLYSNLDELYASGSSKPDQTAQDRYLGLSDRRLKDKFLIEEVWTDNTLVVVGNGTILLRAEPNPYWHGQKPIVIAQVMPDLFELQGISDTENIDDLQQALWTVQNLRLDNLKQTVMRGITYREGGVTDPDALELRPRFKWPVSDHDDIKPFEVQPLPPEAYNEENALLARMQLVTGVNPYVSGSDLSTVDQNTATGVTALQEVASRLLRFKASQLHYKGYLRAFEQWGDMIQQFMTQDTAVEIMGPGSDSQWFHITPQNVVGHFRYEIEGSEESLSRRQARSEALALLNAFAPLAQAVPNINWQALLEKVAAAYDYENPQALFTGQPGAPAQAFPVQNPHGPPQPPQEQPNPNPTSPIGPQAPSPVSPFAQPAGFPPNQFGG